jgi:electron transfer flavoprotein beta subunit
VTSVPDTASVIKIGAEGAIDETGIKWILSPYDEFALEEALKTTEAKGGEVTAVTYGPARAEAVLRDCLARGAHKAVHVIGGETTLGDSAKIAEALAAALQGRAYDLLFLGIQSVGTDNSQVGQMLAEKLDLPHVGGVTTFELGDGQFTASREVEGGRETFECPLPALVTCHKGLNEPRYAALKGIMAAKRKPVEKLQPADLGIDESAAATYALQTLELPPEKGAGQVIQGEDDPAGAAKELVRLLRDEAKAI